MINITKLKTYLYRMTCLCLISLFLYQGVLCYAEEPDMEVESLGEVVQEQEVIEAEELDMGDYEETMEIGAKQLLAVTVLPLDATNQTIIYRSSNENVATVNGMGRITAVGIGTTTITASCGNAEETFTLTVMEKQLENDSIRVEDIELAAHENELEVNKTLNLSATVLPVGAADTTVEFSSDNINVATVSSTGEVMGIAPGTVNITLKAGNVVKTVTLTVKIAATGIVMNSNYVVLKQGETYQLEGTVEPKEAKQTLSYKSADKNIATVSANGFIEGKAVGNTTIIVSNGEMTTAVTVIVNQNSTKTDDTQAATIIQESANEESELIQRIQEQKQTEVTVRDYPILTKQILKALYNSGNSLSIKGDGYILKLCGTDILNYENELHTDLEITDNKKGKKLILNDKKNLPGKVSLYMENQDYKYLYLYNSAKEKYEVIKQKSDGEMELDVEGQYLLTKKPIKNQTIPIVVGVVVCIVVMGCIGGYIFVKKKYWFW